MSFKATKNRKETGEDTFKSSGQRSYDSTLVYDWQKTNEESTKLLNTYATKIQNGEYMSAEDIESYQSAISNYIDSTNNLRDLSKFLGTNSKDETQGLIDDYQWYKTQTDLQNNFKLASEYYSKYDSEDAFKKAVEDQKAYEAQHAEWMSFDLVTGKAEIDTLQALVGEIEDLEKQQQATYNGYQGGARGYANEQKRAELQARIDELTASYGVDSATLSSMLSEKQAYYTQAERAQKAAELASVADVESKNYDPEFEKYAAQGEAFGEDPEKWYKKAENYIAYARNTPELIEAYDETVDNSNAWLKSIYRDVDYYKAAKYMNGKEFKTYNYYFAKDKEDGTNLADEYLNSIEETLNARQAAGIAGDVDGNPVLQTLFAFEAGIDQFQSGVKGWFADGYTPATGTQMASGMIREDLASTGAKLPEWLGGNSLGQVGYDVLNTTANMLPSILTATAVNFVAPGSGAVVGATLMGGSAGGNAKVEMLNLGYSKEQANAYGAMVAVAEGSMEYFLGGISSLGGKLPQGITGAILSKVDNAFARAAITLGGSMLSEGFEEGLQTVIEPWLKEIATGVDWEAPNIDEILYSSLLGALSAFGLEGAGVVAGEVGTYSKGKQIRQTDGGVGKLQALGQTFSADTVAYKIASKVNAQTDAYTIGRLLNEVGATISEQNLTDIVNGLTAKGMNTTVATKLAKQYQTFLNNEMVMTDEQVKILENLSPLADVLRTNIIGSNTTVYQRTRAYSDLMSLADEVSNRKKGKASKTAETPTETVNTSTNIFEQQDINTELQRIASEVATGSRASASERFVKEKVDSAKATAEARLGVEGRYNYSDTGATRLASNNKKVNIVGVDSIDKGTLKLKLDDGTVVDAEEISFRSSDEALVYEAVTNMGVNANTAWEILKGYDPKSGQSGTIYAMGALEAYTYGHNGVKVDGMSKDGFSALLSPVQRNTANRLGDIDAMAKVNAQQKTIDKAVKSVRDEAKSKHKAIPKRKGEVVFEGKIERLTEHQESQIKVLEPVAKGLGVTFHIFESDENLKYTMPDGTIRSANGWYDPKTGEIWIDLHAGNFGQGTIIFTAAHELTHFIKQWSPAKFKIFADFLFEQYGKKGQDVNQLVQRQIEKAAAKNRTIGWDEAYEEVVADSCETFLRDSKAAEKIAVLREKDAGLANKIKTFLGQMLAKMRKVMADLGLAPETPEGQMVAEMTDSLQKLYVLWTDALADAGQAYSTVGGEIDLDGDSNVHKLSDRTMIEGAGLQFIPDEDGTHYTVLDALGNPVKEVTPEEISNSPLGQLVASAKDNGFLGKGKEADIAANKQYKFLAELVNMCINYDGLAPIWETAGTMVFSSIKSNADKQYGLTIDFSTVCKKTQAIVDAMSEAMVRLGRGLTRSEVEIIYLEVGKAGESTPCPVCYVFSRWMGIGGILDQMSRFQDKYTNMNESELQTFIADIKKRISERANTPDKRGNLKSDFFDKNGEIKEGKVIADLKQKANSGAGSTLNAITKNSDTQLQIQELKALMENQDAKEAKKTATKIKKLEAKLVDVSALEKQFKEYNDAVEEYEAYQWLTRTLMEEVDGKWVKNKKFKPVPKDVLFDLNKGATFAEKYPLSWAFRTGKGASAGKAITPYADARVGEAIQGIASQDVKNIKTGIDLNPFLNGDEKTRQKIIASAIEKQARQNLIGGQRYQSTSDFRYEYGSDYLITFLEMQAIGAKVQLYTKVIEAVDFLASMGADINLSVMPLSDGYVTLPNGKKKLIYSSVTGIDAEAAIKKAHEYNNVQLILVGISDEHIRLALEGDDVTFVIPFHGSGNTVHQIQVLMNLLGENLDVTTAEDYTPVQSDHVSPKQTKEQKAMWDLRVKILTGKASTLSASEFSMLDKNAYLKDLYNRFYVNENADEFGINLSKDVAEQIFPYEYWDKSLTYAEADKNGERFKEYCASMGIIPRFSGMNSKGENVGFGDFTNNKGYWKLLIDRPMYDNTYDSNGNWTGYGKYHEQQKINCSNFQVKHLDPEYGSATYGEVMSKANDPKKTNMIVDRAIAQFENAKLSDRADIGINEYSEEDAALAADFVDHMESLINTRGEWYTEDVLKYVEEHPTLDFIERIYAKDKEVKKSLEDFLNTISDVKVLHYLSWYMGEAYGDKDRTWDGWDSKASFPYRGAVRTFRNAIKKRTNTIMTEQVGGTNLGVKNGEVSLADVKDMFYRLNSNEEIGKFAEKVFATAEKLGVNIRFVNQTLSNNKVAGDNFGDMVEYKTSYFNDTAYSDQHKARTLLHELIHVCTVYVLHPNRYIMGDVRYHGKSENYENLSNAATRLNRIYSEIRNDPAFAKTYGIKSVNEMVAELANDEFVGLLKEKNLWDRIVEWICELFGISRGTSAYDNARLCVDYILDNPEISDYKKFVGEARQQARRNRWDIFGKTIDENGIMYSDRVLMGSLFSGGGTLEAGLVYQMLDKEFAVEYNKKIAATYTDNHGKEHMFVGDVRDFNSKEKQNVFYLHASPVCKNFSPASHSGGETTLDITTAQATARVLEEQMPQVFTVENVKRYIGSEAYNIIINKLNELGYTWDVDVYKASDYGNATKRERMIIRAVRDGELPAKPQKVSTITSWGEATRDLWETDLIPSNLVKSKIEAIKNTPQLKGVKPTKLDKPLLIYDTTKSKTVSFAWADELAPTLTTKCGDARIIMPDGRVYAPTPKFMGRIQGLPDDYKYPKAVTNAFKIIGNGIPTQLTKAVMGGVLDSAYEQTHDGQVLYSDRDSSYMDAVNRGDMETAQRMVDEAAKEAGYSVEAYHGTPDARKTDEYGQKVKSSVFTVFDYTKSYSDNVSGIGYFFASNENTAKFYAPEVTERSWNRFREPKVYKTFLNLGNNLVIKGSESSWREIPIPEGIPMRQTRGLDGKTYTFKYANTDYFAKYAKNNGYDSVTFTNIVDGKEGVEEFKGDVYVVFSSEQIKSADPVTYDDNGNVIPLSERFNSENDDIRYSDRTSNHSQAALEKFGTTTDYEIAGFVLEDGKMIKLGVKGIGVNHSKIEQVFDDKKGSDAVNSFIQEGNVRIKASSPGIEISADAPVTVSQLNTLARFMSSSLRGRGYFYLDITDANGNEIGTKTYYDNASVEDIKYDIKKYYRDGTIPSENLYFSDRSPDSVSTRSLLANALETTAQNDIEKNKLAQYKSKIDLIESEYEKLTKLKAEIKELSFAKGKRDTARIKELQFQANQTANRINTYDRQLLNLESTTALKNVLNREKELARRKEAKKGKDALARYKEKAAKTQRELMERNTESRKKAIEGRDKTAMRHEIRNIVEDLNNLLLNPTKDKHIPIGLQKPVAAALAVINMDTVGADERIAKYNDLIAKSNNPDEIARLTKSRDNIEFQGENLKDKLVTLQNAYAALLKSDDPLIKNAHNEAIENLIENTVEKVGDTSLRNMSLEQLEAVYDMFKAIKATVRNANKMFKESKQETITDNSEAVKKEVRAAGGHRERVLKATKFLKKFGWNMLKPIYAMKLIGSDTLTRLYENVRKGEDTWAVDVNEAKDFFKETAKKYEYNVWDFEKQYKFADSAGHSFSLTLEQIMSLYAYSKREQADKHLEFGGFIFDDSIEVTEKNRLGIPMTYEVNDANPYRLKKEDLGKIIDLLESQMPNVKGFVDEMQAYLSDVMGAKGNEVSLAMYDIKLYKEQNYFPLKTAKYFREFDPEKNGTPKIKNSGFSKKTVPQAGNPIILSNFMDVWANHVNDMSMYHAFVLPLEDFMRVYNYSSTAGGYDSVQQYIKNAYGAQANTYIENLMNDLNGGARTDPATDLISKGLSLFKKAAVFASASVVIQQPSAIARALAYVDAKYFVGKPDSAKHKETWAEVKKYAPVAIIKEMGYFDTNMGRSTVDWIRDEKTWRDNVDELASKPAAFADEISWCAIWNAVKREVADSTNLEVGSEEFLKMAGKRFTEVVTKTQVYDSVLSRSALMRSKDSGAKMVTAFMAEPTTSLNMVVDAIIEGKRGNKAFAKKAVGAVAASIIFNSILVSLVTAARDDDDDETYTEKYLESLTAELLDGFNPLTYIPLIKDIWSIAQGYDIERSDMSIWSDLWQSVENLFSDNKSGFEKTEGIVGSIASIFGLPLKNLMRDARAMYNLADTFLSGTPATWTGVGNAIGGAVKDSIPLYSRFDSDSKSEKLYDAMVSGDQKHIERLKAQYEDDKEYLSAVKQALRENDPRIQEAVQAVIKGKSSERIRIQKEIIAEGHFKQDIVVTATNAELQYVRQKINEARKAKRAGKDEEFKKIINTLVKRGYPKDFITDALK